MKLDNGMKILLIQDKEANQAYVGMDVRTGKWNEPDSWPGLAHFMEHMIFLASENEAQNLDNLLQNNGGYSNAYTSDINTNYYYVIQKEGLEKSLEIFQ